jgi:hypothetical protein
MTEPAVGASTWASGSQVWNGNIGTLMAKARAKAAKSHICRAGSDGLLREQEDVEGVAGRRPVERDEGDQHERAARHRVEEELHRGVDAPLVPPDPDEEIHRDQHGFPEDVEEEEVEGHEHAQHPRFQQQHEDLEGLHRASARSSTSRGGRWG